MTKKKKRPSKSKEKKRAPSLGSGALAEKLRALEIEASEGRELPASAPEPKPPAQAEEQSDEELFLHALDDLPARPIDLKRDEPRRSRRRAPGPAAELAGPDEVAGEAASEVASEPAPLKGEALFRAAVESIEPKDLFAGKFHGVARGLPRPPKPAPGEVRGAARPEEPIDEDQVRESILFTREVGPIEPLRPGPELRRQAPRIRRPAPQADEPLVTPPLPRSGPGLWRLDAIDPAWRSLAKRCRHWSRSHELASLNLRGEPVDDALRQLELFVHQHWKDGARFVRIIHGRGLGSSGAPVLKPAVVGWLDEQGARYVRGYAPEVSAEGDWGSILVWLEAGPSRDKKKR